MSEPDTERDARLTAVLEEARSAWRAGGALDVGDWRARHPELGEELAGLLETLRELDTAAEEWRWLSGVTHAWDLGATGVEALPVSEPVPARVGRYVVLGRVGAGGMGTVYRAEDPRLGRVVAVKVPRADLVGAGGAAVVQRFLREARAAARVRHPHVCPIHDVGEQDGVPYVVMDYVEGPSLAARLEGGRPLGDVRAAVELARQVAEGLAAVHAGGLVHRDLKPGNVLLGADGKAVLTDFGLARPGGGEHLTQAGALVGTPAYMAPEQSSGEGERVGPWTDVYGLGLMLYQMLTGRLPVAEEPRPSRRRPEVDAGLDAVVCKALAARPEDRYRDGGEMAEALARWAAGSAPTQAVAAEGVGAGPAVVRVDVPGGGPVTVAVGGGSPPGKVEVAVKERAAKGKRRRRVTVTVTVTFCALLLVSGLLLGGLSWSAREERQRDVARRQESKRQSAERSAAERARAYRDEARAWAARKELEEAVRSARKAVELAPDDAAAHNGLGEVLQARGDLAGAAGEYRKAIALDPKYAAAHNNLGVVLNSRGDLAGAIASYRRALALDPRLAPVALNNLGDALRKKGDLDGAVATYREALRLRLDDALARVHLAEALEGKGRLNEAEASYREAIRLKPDLAKAHAGLGLALQKAGRVQEAIAAYRKAIRLDPRYPDALNNLGAALKEQGDLDGAIAALRRGIRLRPDSAAAHRELGEALRRAGKYREALTVFRALHERVSMMNPGATAEAARLVKETERMARLESRLPAVLSGEATPADASERAAVAKLCSYKERYAASARFWAEAFKSDPKLAEAQGEETRFEAARAAVLAASGRGKDAEALDGKEKGRLRKEALRWLRADLRARTKLLDEDLRRSRSEVKRTLARWKKSPDLAGVRDRDALAKLPEAERLAWARFWADVDAALRRAAESGA
jgi:tetratricopeptide (TPR) repeat protein